MAIVNGQWVPDSPIGIGYGQPVKANAGLLNPNAQFQVGATTDANATQAVGTVNDPNLPANSLAMSNGTGGLAEKGWWDRTVDAFTPQGDKGTSVGGNMMNALGTGVGAVTGLAGMYYAGKNYDLQKDNQKYLRNREAQSDARKSAFATNAGNGAQY